MIYNTNQQLTQYLVEFSMKGDTKNSLQIDVSLEHEEMEETNTEDNSKYFISIYTMKYIHTLKIKSKIATFD